MQQQVSMKTVPVKEGRVSAVVYGLMFIPLAYTGYAAVLGLLNNHGLFHAILLTLALLGCATTAVWLIYKICCSAKSCKNPTDGLRVTIPFSFISREIHLMYHNARAWSRCNDPYPNPTPSPVAASLLAVLSCLVVVLWSVMGWMPTPTVLGLGRTALYTVFGLATIIMLILALLFTNLDKDDPTY
jgi:hypothetical protein